MKFNKSLSLVIAIALSASALTSCGLNINGLAQSIKNVKKSGHTESKNYTFDSSKISGMDIAAGVNVTYTVSDSVASTAVTVETDEAMMPYVVVKLDGNELNIYRESNVSNSNIEINVEVTGPSLTSWEMSSGSQITVNGTVSVSTGAEIDASSGASAKFTSIHAPRLSIDVSSGSIANVAEFNGGKLSVDASSGAIAKITGIRGASVSAEASSGAIVKLDGWAADTDFDTSSGGSIRCSQLKHTR